MKEIQVKFRVTPTQKRLIDKLVKKSGKTQQQFLLERATDIKGYVLLGDLTSGR